MFCGNCGEQIKEGAQYCGNCGSRVCKPVFASEKGKPVITLQEKTVSTVTDSAAGSKKPVVAEEEIAKQFRSLSLWAGILMLSIIFIPMFDMWGGLIPGRSWSFFNVVKMLLADPGTIVYWGEGIVVIAFVPCVVVLLASLLKMRKLSIVFTLIGLGLMVLSLLDILLLNGGWNLVFNFSSCSVSIGYWTALILYIVCLCKSTYIDE